MKKYIFLMLAILFSSTMAMARLSPDFWAQIEEFNECTLAECSQIFSEEEDMIHHKTLPAEVEKELLAVAQDQERVWGDTILEGGYITTGDVELVEVSALKKYGQIFAYRIIYSAPAVYTESCDFDYDSDEIPEDCTVGRITETSIVSADFKEYDIDEDGYANFED